MTDVISYRENRRESKEYKEAYVRGIRAVIEDREQRALAGGNDRGRNIFQNQEVCREQFRAMLGWPLTEKMDRSVPRAIVKKLTDKENCSLYRVSVEILDGLSMTGLLFKKDEKRRPLVIAQHGGNGTPEVIGNLYGDTENYHHMVERLLVEPVNVFAPQLLLWDKSYEVEYDRGALDAKLKRVGSSIAALELYGLSRILDYFETQEYVGNFGMAGLSYGGFYTLFLAALDRRIKSAVSCSFFNSRKNYAWSDWTWFCSAETFSDAEIACLVYPRRLCIEVGTEDELFDISGARDEICRLKVMSSTVSGEWLDVIEFEGKHEFCQNDMPLKRLVSDIL